MDKLKITTRGGFIALALAVAGLSFLYWLAVPWLKRPLADGEPTLPVKLAPVPQPKPQVIEPTGPPPSGITPTGSGQSADYTPPDTSANGR